MQVTKSGLWYMVGKNSNKEKCVEGDTIRMNYKISLLDGTVCYSSDDLGPKTFIVGKGQVISGLEEGILLVNKNSNAKFIIPPHLGYGLIGDEKKIPARATIIYDIELLQKHKTDKIYLN
jgi:FKBP-type peptidyl-prolyl cis-trans isomerase FkpA